jgi:hypothetical protein
MEPRYSLIIPAYNEERLLPRLLDSLDIARASYGDRGAVEVIVADNGSTDRTAEIAADRGCRPLHRLSGEQSMGAVARAQPTAANRTFPFQSAGIFSIIALALEKEVIQ